MPRIYPLFSSSKGNCYYIGTPAEGILLDCGVSFTRIKNALALNELTLDSVKAVFITHEHTDHINGLRVLTKKTGLPVYSSPDTLDFLYDRGHIASQAYDITSPVHIGCLTVSSFPTSHDAVSPCGYRFDFPDGESCAVCTDLGYVSAPVSLALTGCNAVVIEANYDEDMLRCGTYPAELKKRIRSDFGHLSNTACGELAAKLVSNGTTRLILGHLSQENNTPQLAAETVKSILEKNGFTYNRDYLLTCAPTETKGCFCSF